MVTKVIVMMTLAFCWYNADDDIDDGDDEDDDGD